MKHAIKNHETMIDETLKKRSRPGIEPVFPRGDFHKAGGVTIPGQENMSAEVAQIARKWGADAIRDSDGTKLDGSFAEMGYQLYSTICLVRADQEWARKNPRSLVCKYLMSEPVTARGPQVEINIMTGYFKLKYRVNYHDDPKQWWEVIDRTTQTVVDTKDWDYDAAREKVVLLKAAPFHLYTVNFLVYQTWDSTSMYNHMTNNWKKDPVWSVDPYLPETKAHLDSFFDRWLREHPHTDVVRLTTLAYHFALDSDEAGNDKYRDWLGYTDCVSVQALRDFEARMGYALRPEDLVDQGFYNATNRVPCRRYRDWMTFIQDFVVRFGRDLVDKIHQAGKKAAIFWGDHWIGAEFYSPSFQEMGFDINIGACESGTALRRLSDTPGPQTKEIRLYPYLFPDVFSDGNDPVRESQSNWLKIRRALLRKKVDRIGYGGYISLALQYPDFLEHVSDLCEEFRTFLDKTRGTEPYTLPVTVGVIDCWGALRSWTTHSGPDEKFNCIRPDTFEVAGSNLLECLSGLPVNLRFISFDDILSQGIPSDVDVLINDGYAGTAWSGGHYWGNPVLVSKIREWVDGGGGIIGVTDPSAYESGGRYFQLSDVFGVEKETGTSIGQSLPKPGSIQEHFIKEDLKVPLDLGVDKNYVYPCGKQTQVLCADEQGHVHLAVNTFGDGRSVYLAALPYSTQNSRLLLRSVLWAARRQQVLSMWFSSNPEIDCAFYPETGKLAVSNSSFDAQTGVITGDAGAGIEVSATPCEIKWLDGDAVRRRKI